jgi:hypothetical protein
MRRFERIPYAGASSECRPSRRRPTWRTAAAPGMVGTVVRISHPPTTGWFSRVSIGRCDRVYDATPLQCDALTTRALGSARSGRLVLRALIICPPENASFASQDRRFIKST